MTSNVDGGGVEPRMKQAWAEIESSDVGAPAEVEGWTRPTRAAFYAYMQSCQPRVSRFDPATTSPSRTSDRPAVHTILARAAARLIGSGTAGNRKAAWPGGLHSLGLCTNQVG